MGPIPLTEQVVVGPGFHVRPLLPILAADRAFCVLTITPQSAQLFDASRFALIEADSSDLPDNLSDDLVEPDDENHVQASPVARPHTGSISISNAQVYGDSPAEWRKSGLVEFARRVATAVERRLAVNPVPVVLVADAEIGGHSRQLSPLGPLLAGVIGANPESMDRRGAVHLACQGEGAWHRPSNGRTALLNGGRKVSCWAPGASPARHRPRLPSAAAR